MVNFQIGEVSHETVGYFTHSDCMSHNMGHMHPESPMRLDAINARLQAQGLLDLAQFDAKSANLDLIERAPPTSIRA